MMKNLERGRRRNGRMQRRERENQVVMSLQSEESVTELEEGGVEEARNCRQRDRPLSDEHEYRG